MPTITETLESCGCVVRYEDHRIGAIILCDGCERLSKVYEDRYLFAALIAIGIVVLTLLIAVMLHV